jgi:heme exporter protein CcmD
MSDSLASFLQMGGYAQFVWPSYVVALGAIILTSWSARRVLRQMLAEVQRAARDNREDA